jgi:hypothetical protein
LNVLKPHLQTTIATLLAASLKAIEPELPDVALLCSEISELVSSANTSAADSAVVASLSRRKGRFLIYALAREIGSAVKNKRVLDNPGNQKSAMNK